MAKFCTNCGRELTEGEICNCRQTVESGDIFQNILGVLKGIFVKPIETIKENAKEKNFVMSIILVGVMSLITGLFAMAILKNAYSLMFEGASSYLFSTTSIDLPYAKTFFTSLIVVFILSFVYVGLLYLVNTVIFKGSANYKEIYSLYGVVSIINTITLAVSAILVFVNLYVAIIVLVFGALLSLLYTYHGLKFIGPDDENKYGYIFLTTTALYFVVIFVITKIFS